MFNVEILHKCHILLRAPSFHLRTRRKDYVTEVKKTWQVIMTLNADEQVEIDQVFG